jgi:predicted branched-subunit amino acid permease
MWIEALRLLPPLPREHRIPFVNGLGLSFMLAAQIGGGIGYYLATSLPPLLSAALLFLTPMSFLISTTRNCRLLSDWLALVFGLVLGPLLAFWQVGLDLLWTGIVGGSLALASIACARRADERRAPCLCAAGAGRLSAQ